MSLEAMVWAMKQPFNDKGEKLLLLSLANYANEEGVCWPGYGKLKEDSLIKSKTTIGIKLKAMEERGLIIRQRRPRQEGGSSSNKYKLNLNDFCPLNKTPEVQKLDLPESPKNAAEGSKTGPSFYSDTCQNRTSKTIYTDSFNFWWSSYPNRQGDQGSKKKTFQRYQKLLSDGFTESELLDAVIRYNRFCTATAKVGTEYVKQTTTFLNNTENLKNPWTVNHERHPAIGSSRHQERESLAEYIHNAPGCESLSAADQDELFGQRSFQDHGSQEAYAAEVYVPDATIDGGRQG